MRNEGKYVNGRKQGPWRRFYNFPKKEGPYEGWHRNGVLAAKGRFRDDKWTGHWTFFQPDGSKAAEGPFLNGKQHGDWTTWDRKGQQKSQRFHEGVRVH